MITLYDYYRSSAAYRVRITLNLKELEYKTQVVHLVNNGGEQHSKYYKSLNPAGLVPTLVDKDYTITQSLTIIEYLEDAYPETYKVIPKDKVLKLRTKQIANTVAIDMHPLNNLRVLKYLVQNLNVNDEQKMQWYHYWLKQGFNTIEALLINWRSNCKFAIDNNPTLADVCLIPQVYNALRFKFEMSSYANIMQVYENCLALENFHAAAPEQVEHIS